MTVAEADRVDTSVNPGLDAQGLTPRGVTTSEGALKQLDRSLGYLSMLILADVIEVGGEMPVDKLRLQLEDEGLNSAQTHSADCLDKLRRKDLLMRSDGKVAATGKARDYVAFVMATMPNGVEQARSRIRELQEFSADRYTILSQLSETRGGWVLQQSQMVRFISEEMDISPQVVTEVMQDFRKRRLIEEEYPKNEDRSHDRARIKLKRSKAGKKELNTLHEVFPRETNTAQAAYDLRSTIIRMCTEINMMHEELNSTEGQDGIRESDDDRAPAAPGSDEFFRALDPDTLEVIRGKLDGILYALMAKIDGGNIERINETNAVYEARLAAEQEESSADSAE